MPPACSPLHPDIWLRDLVSSRAVRDGGVIRHKARDIERFAGWQAFLAEIDRRGYRAYENSGQVLIFCDQAPIRRLR